MLEVIHAPEAVTAPVSGPTRTCHPVPSTSGSLHAAQTRSRTEPGTDARLRSAPPQLLSPRFAHSIKQSRAVVSSARLFGRTSSRVTSLPLNTALAARRTLELAWPLNVLIQVWSGERFTRKRTKTRLSDRFPSNVGSLTRMIAMTSPHNGRDAQALRSEAQRGNAISVQDAAPELRTSL